MNDLKKYILENCFTKSGKQIIPEQFMSIEEKGNLINATNFLPPNTHMSLRIKYILSGFNKLRLCPVCGEKIDDLWEKQYRDLKLTCSRKCAGKLAHAIGADKRKTTCLIKYNSSTPFGSTNIQNKVKESVLRKYGVNNISQSNIIKYKKQTTFDNKTYEERTNIYKLQTESRIKSSYTDHQLKRLKHKRWMQFFYNKYTIIELSKILNVAFSTVNTWLIRHNIPRNNWNECSFGEKEVVEYIKTIYAGAVIQFDRKLISPLEIDIYLPEKKLAIEFNGIYWHSDVKKSKNYHLNKTNLCEKRGIRLLHIFSNEWDDKKDIWKSVIANKLGVSNHVIGARQTKIKTIDFETSKMFLNTNHLQGSCISSIRYGLFYKDELVSIMTFGKSRYNKSYKWELLRFCVKIGHKIHGAASKILAHFRKNHKGSIISYANRRWSDGGLYESIGFNFLHNSLPNYWYVKNGNVESRIKYQKHKLHDKLVVFDNNLSEAINMKNNRFFKLYDSGNMAFTI